MFSRVPPLRVPKRAYRNEGELRFKDVSREWGFDWMGVANGMALGDLDDDGDLDVVFNALNEGSILLRNNSEAPRIRVRLKGRPPNTHGVGARIEWDGHGPRLRQQVVVGGRYLSSDDTTRVFAAGQGQGTLSIRWRSGRTTETNVTGQASMVIEESK